MRENHEGNAPAYMIGVLCGVVAGITTGYFLNRSGVNAWLVACVSILAAGAVASLLLMLFQFLGQTSTESSAESETSPKHKPSPLEEPIPTWKIVEMESNGGKPLPYGNRRNNRMDSIKCKYCRHFQSTLRYCRRKGDDTLPDNRCGSFALTDMDVVAKEVTGVRPDGTLILDWSD